MQESLNSLLVLLPSWPLCYCHIFYFEFSSVAQPSLTLCNLMDCSMPGLPLSITNSWSLLKLMSVESVMPSNHLMLCRPLLLLPSLFASIRVFLNESVLRNRWPKDWSFSFSISPSSEYSGLICWISLQSKGLSRVFSNTTAQKHQLFGTQPSSQSNSYIHIWPLEKPSPPSWASLPSHQPTLRSSESIWLGSLCYTAASHKLSVWHMLVYICLCYFLHSSHSLLPSLWPQVCSLYLRLNPMFFK